MIAPPSRVVIGLLSIGMALAACSAKPSGQTGPSGGDESRPPVLPALIGHELVLSSLSSGSQNIVFPVGVRASISFQANQVVTGYSGVNTFTGSYELQSSSLRWTSPFASTRRGGPPEAMEFERTFLKVLRACVTLDAGSKVTLSGPEGTLVFQPAMPEKK